MMPNEAKDAMDEADVILAKGQGNYESMSQFIKAVNVTMDADSALRIILNLYNQGVDPKQFIYNCMIFLLDINKKCRLPEYCVLPDLPIINDLASSVNYLDALNSFSKLYDKIRYENNPMPIIEINILQWCSQQ